jgi:hypothetical protein
LWLLLYTLQFHDTFYELFRANYFVVKFDEDEDGFDTVDIVCQNWFEERIGNTVKLAYPSKKEYKNIRSYLRDLSGPLTSWKSFKGTLKFGHGMYFYNFCDFVHSSSCL